MMRIQSDFFLILKNILFSLNRLILIKLTVILYFIKASSKGIQMQALATKLESEAAIFQKMQRGSLWK